jgi:hypothetical protein
MNIGQAFEMMPLTERTIERRWEFNKPIVCGTGLTVDPTGAAHEWDVSENGTRLGMVYYHGGRKLSCYTYHDAV